MAQVLVTGGSGFIGMHCILRLLADGHRVRATVRDVKRGPGIIARLSAAGAQGAEAIEFQAADLGSDAGWASAARGCDFALHVASPLPPGEPKRADDLIVPAREGALRLLRAARDAGVKRVVLTSSFAAIGYGHAALGRPFDEKDWTHLDARGLSAYVQSKTQAERAAWDFIAKEGKGIELATVKNHVHSVLSKLDARRRSEVPARLRSAARI